jgi:hypothetical protein
MPDTLGAVQATEAVAEAQDTPVPTAPISERRDVATAEEALEGEKPALAADDGRKRLQRALSSVARREEQVLQQQRQFRQQQQEFDRKMQAVEQRLKQAEDRERKIQALYESENVIEAFQEAGLDFPKLVERIASHGSPESMVRHTSSRLEQKIASLEEKLSEQTKWRQDRETQELTTRQQAEVEDGRRWVANEVRSNWKKYPNLATFPGAFIASQIESEAERYNEQHGQYPNLDVLASRVENNLRQLEELRAQQRKAFQPETAPSEAPEAAPGAPRPKAARAEASDEDVDAETRAAIDAARNRHANGSFVRRATTITNKDASSRASAPKRPSQGDRAALRKHVMAKHGL